MATDVDAILGRTSRFFNKRMRQMSSLITLFVIKFIPYNFSYITITICRSFKVFLLGFIDLELVSVYKYKKEKQRTLANIQPWTYYWLNS